MKTLIETVVSQMSASMGFIYAKKYQFNLSADEQTLWPLVVLLPLIMKKQKDKSGKLKTNYFFQILFLNRSEIEPDPEVVSLPILEALEDNIDEFIFRLEKVQKWKPNFEEVEFIVSPVPPEFDVPSDGYIMEFELSPFPNKSICL